MAYPLFLAKLLIKSGIARWLPSVKRLTGGGGAFLRYYSDHVLAAPYPELSDAAEYLEVMGPDGIDLALGSPRFDLVPSGSTKLPADRRGFPPPWGVPELCEAIARQLQAGRKLDVSPSDEVLITHGGAGAISIILDTFHNRGDRVVLVDPCSPLYIFMLRHRRARIRWLSTQMEEGHTRFHLEPLMKAMRWARMIFLTSPNNPTGGTLKPEDLEQIAWCADRRDVLIVHDEVFERYRYDGNTVHIGTFPKARRRTLTVGSVSKSHALASFRVGWVAGHRHLVQPCALTAALHTPFVPTLCQQVALTALRQDAESFQPIRTEFASRRQYAFERLQAMGLKPAWPAGGFFMWVPVQQLGLTGKTFAERLLQSKKVLVWPGDFFGPSGQGFIRLSFAAEDGRLREGLARLAEFVREVQPEPTTEEKQAA